MLPTQTTAQFPQRAWMQNGLGFFLQAQLMKQNSGRAGALRFLDQYQTALAHTEELGVPKPDAGAKTSQRNESDNTLLNTTDELLLRVKGGFVFWMLDEILGNTALQQALVFYRPEQDKDPAYLQKLLEKRTKENLEWFFDDWVYRDRGLPDFRVVGVCPHGSHRGYANTYQVTSRSRLRRRGHASASRRADSLGATRAYASW